MASDEWFMKIAKHVASGPSLNLWPLRMISHEPQERREHVVGYAFTFIYHSELGYKLTIDINVIEFKWYAERLSINHSYVPPTFKSVCIYPSHFKFNTLGMLQLGCHGYL